MAIVFKCQIQKYKSAMKTNLTLFAQDHSNFIQSHAQKSILLNFPFLKYLYLTTSSVSQQYVKRGYRSGLLL
jgi:hypothetical protein